MNFLLQTKGKFYAFRPSPYAKNRTLPWVSYVFVILLFCFDGVVIVYLVLLFWKVLKERLKSRGTESPESIDRRMATAVSAIEYSK